MKISSIHPACLIVVVMSCFVLFIVSPKGLYAASSYQISDGNPISSCYTADLSGNTSPASFSDVFKHLNEVSSPIYGRSSVNHETSRVHVRTARLPDWQHVLPRYTTAVLERIEGRDKAVILMESLHAEIIVSKQDLPAGAEVNTWFAVRLDKQRNVFLTVCDEQTKREQERADTLRRQLRFVDFS